VAGQTHQAREDAAWDCKSKIKKRGCFGILFLRMASSAASVHYGKRKTAFIWRFFHGGA
jgi:hypothetical protein